MITNPPLVLSTPYVLEEGGWLRTTQEKSILTHNAKDDQSIFFWKYTFSQVINGSHHSFGHMGIFNFGFIVCNCEVEQVKSLE